MIKKKLNELKLEPRTAEKRLPNSTFPQFCLKKH